MVLVVAIAWRGGYGQDARAAVAVLAGLAVLVTFASGEAGIARSPVVWSLVAVGLLSALSAAWTVGSAGVALRDGLAIVALAAVVVVAAAVVRSAWQAAAVLLVAAVAIALVGIVAAIAKSDPLALEICGSWRPAGPFEYPPTLGLVCAGALPVALGIERRMLGAGLAWLLALTVALTANRTAIAFGGAALVAAVWLAPRWRSVAPVALAVIAAAGLSVLAIGGDLGDAGALRILLAVVFAAIPVAIARRESAGDPRGAGFESDPRRAAAARDPRGAASARDPQRAASPRDPQRAASAPDRRGGHGAWIAAVAVAAIAAAAIGTIADRGSGCQGDASHGRVGIWKAAVATAGDRPLQGFGSGTFLAASRQHQLDERPRPTRFAHNQILESWAELGIAGAALALAWMVATLMLAWRSRRRPGAWLLVPYVAAFPLANLLDWPWHLLGAGVLWALCAGALLRES